MLVRFVSSETGEVLMFAETAAALLQPVGKERTARGVFTPAEMLPAAEKLRQAVAQAEEPPEDNELDEKGKKKPPVVGLRQRAWPLIDMLERTARSGPDASIIWEAPQAF